MVDPSEAAAITLQMREAARLLTEAADYLNKEVVIPTAEAVEDTALSPSSANSTASLP